MVKYCRRDHADSEKPTARGGGGNSKTSRRRIQQSISATIISNHDRKSSKTIAKISVIQMHSHKIDGQKSGILCSWNATTPPARTRSRSTTGVQSFYELSKSCPTSALEPLQPRENAHRPKSNLLGCTWATYAPDSFISLGFSHWNTHTRKYP